jgi:hypothetical protein
MPQPLEFEGSWEEIVAYAPELTGPKVRLTILTPENLKPTLGDSASGVESSTSLWDSERPEEFFARQSIQPVKALAIFLESLPDFGDDAISLWEAISEDRAQRRALTANNGW